MYQDARPCRLFRNDLRNAAGCGTDTGDTVFSRSGISAAAAHATAAPQSCPTRCTCCAPLASINAPRSPTSVGDGVVAAAGRSGAGRVSTLVGCQTAVALRGQAVYDGVPAVVVLGEAVQQHNNGPVGGPGVADIEGQAIVAIVVHSSRVHAGAKELYAGSVELVGVRRTTGHAHDQRQCGPRDQGTAPGGERPIVCLHPQIGDAATAGHGEVAARKELRPPASMRRRWVPLSVPAGAGCPGRAPPPHRGRRGRGMRVPLCCR